jgi:hypothetical protein
MLVNNNGSLDIKCNESCSLFRKLEVFEGKEIHKYMYTILKIYLSFLSQEYGPKRAVIGDCYSGHMFINSGSYHLKYHINTTAHNPLVY